MPNTLYLMKILNLFIAGQDAHWRTQHVILNQNQLNYYIAHKMLGTAYLDLLYELMHCAVSCLVLSH